MILLALALTAAIDFNTPEIDVTLTPLSPITTQVDVDTPFTEGFVHTEIYCQLGREPIVRQYPVGEVNKYRRQAGHVPLAVTSRGVCRYPTDGPRSIFVIVTATENGAYGQAVNQEHRSDSGFCNESFLGQWWQGRDLKRAVRVCEGESRGDPFAYNDNALCRREWNADGTGGNGKRCKTRGDVSVGLFQVNLRAHCRGTGAFEDLPRYSSIIINPRIVDECFNTMGWGDPYANTDYAYSLWEQSGWCPWSVGKHLGYCGSHNRKEQKEENRKEEIWRRPKVVA